jgi:hypothetical protein
VLARILDGDKLRVSTRLDEIRTVRSAHLGD